MTADERVRVWRVLGAPAEQLGSVNEPRVCREHDVDWNEKWVYLSHSPDRHGEVERIVLWNRYDLVGIFSVKPDGSVARESLADESDAG
jgi:hypothetical protein